MKTRTHRITSLLVTMIISLVILSSSCSPRTHRTRIKVAVTSNSSLQASAHLYKENWSSQDRFRFSPYSSKYADSRAYQKRKADEKKAFKYWIITIAGCFGAVKILTH